MTSFGRVLVTGANGFIGRAVCRTLVARGTVLRAAVRCAASGVDCPGEVVVVGDLDGATDWTAALAGVEAVVHLAGRAHVLKERAEDPLTEFRRVNAEGSAQLARCAAAAGVRRLVLVSSIGVHGDVSGEHPFTAEAPIAPVTPYARSKREAEVALWRIARESGLAVVVVRPPLVYGPGVGGNFQRLLRLADSGLPLPLGGLRNRRNLVGVDNLADALALCARHPEAVGRTFTVCDGPAFSTPELIRILAHHLGRPARLWPVPGAWLRRVGRWCGLGGELVRLTGSLEVDDRALREDLGWVPPVTAQSGLAAAAEAFRRGIC